MKLAIEYVPSSSWGKNLRDVYTPYQWQKISKKIQSDANNTCEICERTKDGQIITRLYCHEVWSYDLTTKIQRLEKLQCLCFECHSVIHIGFSNVQGYDLESLKQHFMKVNQANVDDFNKHLNESNELLSIRGKIEWTVDFNDFDQIDTTSPRTEALLKQREAAYKNIESYLKDNPRATNGQIQRGTGVSISRIKNYFINLYGLK